MTIDLNELARQENERTEWKENVADADDVLKTICAFANDFNNLGGGYIVCGAKEIKNEYGFPEVVYTGLTSERYKKLLNQIPNDCASRINAPVVPEMITMDVEDRPDAKILAFIVRATGQAHTFRNRQNETHYYVRIGSHTKEARNGLYTELLMRKGKLEPWDKRPNPHTTEKDIRIRRIEEFFQKAEITPQTNLENYLSDTRVLTALTPSLCVKEPLTQQLKLRNFATLLFTDSPVKWIDGAHVHFSVYQGADRSEPRGERKTLTGSIIDQTEILFEWLDAENSTLFNKNGKEHNISKYPLIALQEAVVNAIVHRDYELRQPIRVTVFSDRVEILSPGSLHREIDKEAFKMGKGSIYWRNQSLCDLFYRLKFAQGEGQGINTMIKSLQRLGSPPPVFEITDSWINCTLYAHPLHQEYQRNRLSSTEF